MTNQRRHTKIARHGFTLIELLIVIAILLAIGGLVVVNLIPRGEQAKADLQLVQFDQVDGALKQFRLNLNRWPTEEEGLAALWEREAMEDEEDFDRWRGPYMEDKLLKDQWGNELVYRYPGEIRGESFYDLISIGPDKEEDTDDDITNHDRLRDVDGEIAEEFEDFTPADADDGS